MRASVHCICGPPNSVRRLLHLGSAQLHTSFGVLVVVNSMIGLITPPYGILLFVINAVTDIPLKEIIGEIWAFLGVLLAALGIMILFPNVILWLPGILGH